MTCSSAETIFLVVEEQGSTCSRLNSLLLFTSKAHGMLWSYTKNFTINRRLAKTFAKLSNEKSPILVTRFLGNEWWNIDRKLLPLHYLNTEEKEDKKTTQAIAKLFASHANAIMVLQEHSHDTVRGISLFCR